MAMPPDIADFFGRGKKSEPHVFFLPAPAGNAPFDPDAGEYFQIRLSDMYLSEDVRWMKEIAPAAFLQTEFNYAGAPTRKPFFVSNSLLPELPVSKKGIRARLSNTSVIGPVPYKGGDVVLFLGLFQTALKDWRAIAFDVFETVVGPFAAGPVSKYLQLADKMSSKILECLGQGDVESILADRRPVGKNALPASGYWAYLRALPDGVDPAKLRVVDDTLHIEDGGGTMRYEASDYCLVQVERSATRNDYASMPAHGVWEEARKLALAGKAVEAQGAMLDCARQILASPDLTEGDKEELIKLYQAKLHTAADLLQGGAPGATANRGGSPAMLRSMQALVVRRSGFEADELGALFDRIGKLASDLEKQPCAPAVDERGIEEHLRQARGKPAGKPDPAALVRALALGSVAGTDTVVR
jgi:hypothetical protein